MSPALTTFLFELVNFLLLAGALGWLLFRPVRRFLAAQQAELDAATDAAHKQQAEATQARAAAEAARQSLHQELRELRERELAAARRQAEQIVAQAREAAEQERAAVRRQMAQLADDELGRLARAAAAAAAASVATLLSDIRGPDLQSALVRSACEQLRRWPPTSLGTVKVESAEPLSAPHRAAVEAALGANAAQALFAVDADLQTGIRISTDRGLIDASASGLAGFARQAFLRQLNSNSHLAARPKVNHESPREPA